MTRWKIYLRPLDTLYSEEVPSAWLQACTIKDLKNTLLVYNLHSLFVQVTGQEKIIIFAKMA